MVSVKKLIFPLIILLTFLAVGCESTDRRAVKEKPNIYASLQEDKIEHHEEEKVITKGSPEYLANGIRDLKALYLRKKYSEAEDIGLRLIKLAPSLAETYYWMGRIALDRSDYQQALEMVKKGLSVAEDRNMRAQLEDVKLRAEMGAN
jgi:tetratricopeptide (TPR) repeat protein